MPTADRRLSRIVTEIADDQRGQSMASTTARAYDELRTILLSGAYPPNTRLTEADLTARLGISRGTLRSVLARLVQKGYLVSEANRGVWTRYFSVDEAQEILETRELLESALAARAAQRATNEDIAGLKEIVQQMSEVDHAGGREEYSRLIRHFHERIRETARQQTLSNYIEMLLYPLVLRQYRPIDASRPRPDSLAEQQAILSAIVTHNPDAAAAAMRHHVSAAHSVLHLTEPDSEPTEGRASGAKS